MVTYFLLHTITFEDSYDSNIKALAADLKKPLLELISNATVMDFSGFDGYKDSGHL